MPLKGQSAHWVISHDGKAVQLLRNGRVIPCSALDIWEAEFESKNKVRGISIPPPSDSLPQLQFSRFPIELDLELSGSRRGGISARYLVRDTGKPMDVPQSGLDQVVVDDTWYMVDQGTLSDIEHSLERGAVKIPGRVTVGQYIWLKGASLGLQIVDNTSDLEASKSETTTAPLPGIIGTLFPYQEVGVGFLLSTAKESLGCVLADEMGLGKTVQVICLLASECSENRRPNLVVCPATLLENWRRELSVFAPRLTVLTHRGSMRTGDQSQFLRFDVILTSYETATRDEPMLSSVRWNVAVLDEAQNIRNPQAQRTEAVKGIPRRVSVAVTGTPVENRLTDLWSIMDFALPGLLGSKESFEMAYDDTKEDATRLAPLVSPIMLRRKVDEVADDLPRRIDIPQILEMSGAMASAYEALRLSIEEEYGESATLVALTKLRQFCAHPFLIDGYSGDPSVSMSKYQRLLEILEEIFSSGEKALVFTSFLEMSDILVADVARRFPNAWIAAIDGRIPVAQRQEIIDEFSNHPGHGFLSLNPKAAGVGLNITAANHVVHYNPEWNPAVVDQASARAYRRKQRRIVTVHYLYFKDSVEEVMIDRLDLKRELSDRAVVGHTGEANAADIARALHISPLATFGGG